MAVVAADLTLIGDGIVSMIKSIGNVINDVPKDPPDWWTHSMGAIPFGIGDALRAIYTTPAAAWNGLVDLFKGAVSLSWNLLQCVVCEKPAALIGALLARSIVRSLRGVRIGVNAVIEGGFGIDLQFDQVDQALQYIIHWLCPYSLPDPATANDWHKRGLLSDSLRECYSKIAGHDATVWHPAYIVGQGIPGENERKQFLYRLNSAAQQGAAFYTDEDYRAGLKFDGWNDKDIERLFETRYRVFQIRQVQMLLDTGSFVPGAMEKALRAEGFAPDDVTTLAHMEMVHYKRRHESEIQGWTPATIKRLWSTGFLIPSQVSDRMKALSYSDDDAQRLMDATIEEDKSAQLRKAAERATGVMYAYVDKAYNAGLMTGNTATQLLQAIGWGLDSITLLLQSWDGESEVKRRQTASQCVKKGWESGYMSNFHATETLITIGYSPLAAADMVGQWQGCRDENQSVLAAQQDIAAMGQGLLSPADTLARLVGHGFAVGEAEFLIAGEQQKLDKATLSSQQRAMKAEQAAEKAKEKQDAQAAHAAQVAANKAAAAALRLARQAAAAAKAAASEIRKQTPPSLLKTLLKRGLISVDAYTERMTCMGESQQTIELEIANVASDPKATVVQSDGPEDSSVPACPAQ
jgi:hypothetical protein